MALVNINKPEINAAITAAGENGRLTPFITTLDNNNIAHEGIEHRNIAGMTQLVTHKTKYVEPAQVLIPMDGLSGDVRQNVPLLNVSWAGGVSLLAGDLVRIYLDVYMDDSKMSAALSALGLCVWLAQPYWDVAGAGVFTTLPGHSPHGSNVGVAAGPPEADFYAVHEGLAISPGNFGYQTATDTGAGTYRIAYLEKAHFMLSYDFVLTADTTVYEIKPFFSGAYHIAWDNATNKVILEPVTLAGFGGDITISAAKLSVMVLRG